MDKIILEYKNNIQKLQSQMSVNKTIFSEIVSNKEEQIKNLTTQLEEQKQSNALLQNNLGKIQNENDSLKRQLEQQKQSAALLQNNLGKIQNENDSLKRQLEEQKQSAALLQNNQLLQSNALLQNTNINNNVFNSLENKKIIKTITFSENGEDIKSVEFI
jgi:hypothetical protein